MPGSVTGPQHRAPFAGRETPGPGTSSPHKAPTIGSLLLCELGSLQVFILSDAPDSFCGMIAG